MQYAIEHGINRTVHAGESRGPESIKNVGRQLLLIEVTDLFLGITTVQHTSNRAWVLFGRRSRVA